MTHESRSTCELSTLGMIDEKDSGEISDELQKESFSSDELAKLLHVILLRQHEKEKQASNQPDLIKGASVRVSTIGSFSRSTTCPSSLANNFVYFFYLCVIYLHAECREH